MVPGGRDSQDFSTVGTGWCQVVNLTHRSFSSNQMYSCYCFRLDAESTPVPECGRKDSVNEKFQTLSGIETRDPPAYATAYPVTVKHFDEFQSSDSNEVSPFSHSSANISHNDNVLIACVWVVRREAATSLT